MRPALLGRPLRTSVDPQLTLLTPPTTRLRLPRFSLHPTVHPEPGWHEHDPSIYTREIDRCIEEGLKQFKDKGHELRELKCVGIATQRETTLLWDKETGEPLYNASASLQLAHVHLRGTKQCAFTAELAPLDAMKPPS